MTIPLVILATLSIVGGFIELPENLGPVRLFSKLLTPLLPSVNVTNESTPEWIFQIISAIVSTGGILIAYFLFFKESSFSVWFGKSRLSNFFYKGWGFDWLYNKLIVTPIVWFSEINKRDFIDKFYTYLAMAATFFNKLLSRMQNGKLRWYITVLTAGIIVLLTIMLTV